MKVTWPASPEMLESAALLRNYRERGTVPSGVFIVVDGGRLPCADYVDAEIQNEFHGGGLRLKRLLTSSSLISNRRLSMHH